MPYKRGFTNIFATQWEEVNLNKIADLDVTEITPESLYEAGITRGLEFPVKLLGNGEISSAFKVSVHAVSEGAKSAIEAAGGSVELVERTDRWVSARPRSRRLPINRDLKKAGFGKSGEHVS
jgi:large subunit ribosomal protein L15